ncbi:hypothetical protein JXA02_04500 [candidate division KSB1 bacterium]|nr:hypothetical protein [candidate division KSB1 bacterium]RQW08814.1 MAG: hypothetical protein EH222_05115 [candidate division KSB1 bacterium]
MTPSKKIAILSFITVFIAGIAVGVVLEDLVFDKKQADRRKGDPNDFLFAKLTQELSLTTAQQDSLRSMLDKIKEEHRKLNRKRFENFEQIRLKFDQEFRKILDEKQMTRYDEMMQEFETRRKKHPQPR